MQNSNLAIFSVNKKEQNPEIRYIKNPVEVKESVKPPLTKKEPFLKIPSKITLEKRIPPPFVDKESIFKGNRAALTRSPDFDKPTFIKPDILAIKKKITLPPIDMNKINNPSYISYYQIIREKIKRAAYQNYTGQEIGEVSASFIVSRDGTLRELQLAEEKSSSSDYLRGTALRSIRDASPFPNFPEELNFPQLSFNLVITFEIE